MPFTEILPRWEAPGSAPPLAKVTGGWSVSEKPPADWFNYQWTRSYWVMKELQEKAALAADLTAHIDTTATPHGATTTATASRLVIRDAAGRAQVAAPSAAGDIAIKSTVDAAIATAAGDATTKANNAQSAAIAAAAADATTKADAAQAAAIASANTALALKAPLASPTFTGTPIAPTAPAGTNTDQISTTKFVTNMGALKANIASPAFTGTPTGPTPPVDTSSTQLATAEFVLNQAGTAAPGRDYNSGQVGTSKKYAREDHRHPATYPDDYKTAAALPSTYPVGSSIFFALNANGGGWPSTYGTIHTIRGYESGVSAIQYFYPYNVAAPVKLRIAYYPDDVWGSWMEVITSGGPSVTTLIPKLNADMADGFHFNQGVQSTDTPTFAGLNTTADINSTGNINITRAAPVISLKETDQAVDEKLWWMVVDGKMFQLRTLTDAGASGATAMSISRGTGTAPTQVDFPGLPVSASRFQSSVATGTAPFTVTSTTAVANLNVDLHDGYHANTSNVANTVAVRDSSSVITANRFTSTIATGTAPFTVTSTTLVNNLNADLLNGFGTSTTSANSTVAVRSSTGVLQANQLQSTVATGTAPLVVSSTTLVTNLNANYLAGLAAQSASTANSIPTRDANKKIAEVSATRRNVMNITYAPQAAYTSITSFVAPVEGNYEAKLYLMNAAAASTISLQVWYADANGAQTLSILDNMPLAANSSYAIPQQAFFYAASGSTINLVYKSSGGNVSISATIQEA